MGNNNVMRNLVDAYKSMYTDDPDQLDEIKFGDLDLIDITRKIKELTNRDQQTRMDEIVLAVGRYATLTGNTELKKHSKALFAAGRAMADIASKARL